MPEEKLGPPAPVVLAMILCDAIHQDPATKKCTLLGTFSTVTARQFPAVHPGMAVHVAMTDGRGKTRIRLSLVGSKGDEPPIFNQEGTIQFPDPRAVAELNFGLRNVTFPQPGEYRLQVYANDELLSERRLYVFGMRQGPPDQAPPGPPPSSGDPSGKQPWQF